MSADTIEIIRDGSAFAWTNGAHRVEARDATIRAGKVQAVVTVFTGGALVHRSSVNLTADRERARYLGKVEEAGCADLPGEILLALEETIRQDPPPTEERETGHGRKVDLQDPDPHPELVDGAELLGDVAGWIAGYVHLPRQAVDAVTLWALATWFVEVLYYAPPLQLHSATKRSGKTLLLDLLRPIVRRGYMTSGIGVTPAVVFRLNEASRPTFLVDEAEKLGGGDADRNLVGLFNAGYRRGAVVARCVEPDFEPREFDAFGFRALAAIRSLWDTIEDRAIRVTLTRKAKGIQVRRFNGRTVEEEGAKLARRAVRWAKDHAGAVGRTEATTPRPEWLDDRACDSWAPLFAVAQVAGGEWPERAEAAARYLGRNDDEGDRGERMIHDLRTVFEARGTPEVIPSNDLVEALNEIETSPWGDYRGGDGITPHKLAALLRPFEVGPEQRRTGAGTKVRGWWRADLEPLFERYPPPTPPREVGQAGQSSNGAGSDDSQSGTDPEACPTSENPETRMNKGMSHLSHSEEGGPGGVEPEPEPVPDMFGRGGP